MADAIFGLCALTSLTCATLLWRAYRRQRVRLLLWTALCFAGLFLNNIMLILDLRVLPQIDLAGWRVLPAIAGVGLLLYGLIWDSE
ncbi:MAG: DUF5985 family protein [Gemmatimonadaceae bacterium]